jgi:hypothetical protein
MRLILSLFSQLTDEERLYGPFMKDNTTAHTVNNSVDELEEVFGEQIIRTVASAIT